MLITTPGVCAMTPAQYHADPVAGGSLSSSIARTLLSQSPGHARWQMDNPRESKAFDIGRAAHRSLLGKGDDFAVCPEELLASNGAMSTKAAKEWAEDMRARGITPIKAEEAAAVAAMTEAAREHLALCGLTLDPAHSEVAAFGKVEGVWCRALIDNAPDGADWLLDLKTTTDASPEACIRAVTAYGYDVQAAHYLETWNAATGEDRRFLFLFVEKEAPHGCSLVELYSDPADPADWMLDARSKTAEARRIWSDCKRTGNWPKYPAGIAVIGAPAWHRSKWADRSIGPSADALATAYEDQSPLRAARKSAERESGYHPNHGRTK